MTDLHIALLAAGVLAVVGVFAYNRFQERSARRRAEEVFPQTRPDVLMDSRADARREPVLDRAARRAEADAGHSRDDLPDPRLDYVVELTPHSPIAAAALVDAWAPVAGRFGRRALLAGIDTQGRTRRIAHGATGDLTGVWAGVQLVSRQGVTGEAEVVEFRAAVETLAATLGAEARAPEMRSALDEARSLDRACADADIQVVVHVVSGNGRPIPQADADSALARLSLGFASDGRAEVRDDAGRCLYCVILDASSRQPGLSLVLDVPRTPALDDTYREMVAAARTLAAALGGTLRDDAGQVLDDRALAAIGAELARVRTSLEALGVAPGGPLALRLFA